MTKIKFLLMLCLTALINSTVSAQSISSEKLIKAINEMATYSSDVVLDKDGKSRCDYNLIDGKWYPYEVPWHTGQIILGLLDTYKITGDKKYLDAAKKAGDWWISLEIKNDPTFAGMIRAVHGDDVGENQVVFATTTDGTHGLFELTKVTGDKKYANVATSAIKWLKNKMYYPEKGVCYDFADIKTAEVLKDNSPFHPDKKNQDLYDVARPNTEGSPFKDVYEYTGDTVFLNADILLCNSILDKQTPEGAWMNFTPNSIEKKSFHPRFNLWYAESLLDAYDLTKDKKYLESAARTARLYANVQTKDGTIYYDNFLDGKSDKSSVCGSATALAGIIWIRLAGYGYTEFIPNYERSAKWLLINRFSQTHPDPNLRGAVIDTRVRSKKGENTITQRDVGTTFGMRFLAAYYNLKFKK